MLKHTLLSCLFLLLSSHNLLFAIDDEQLTFGSTNLTVSSMAELVFSESPNFEDLAKASISSVDTQSVMSRPKRKMEKVDWSKKSKKNPTLAGAFSAVLPGLGQIYNGQWYKAPVIYLGAGVLYYFIDMNIKEKRIYENEIFARVTGDSLLRNPLFRGYSDQSIIDVRNYYQNNFELSIIIASVVYLLNIVDAVVYAHLFTYDVSLNLSLHIKPYAQPNFMLGQSMPLDAGIRLSMRIR